MQENLLVALNDDIYDAEKLLTTKQLVLNNIYTIDHVQKITTKFGLRIMLKLDGNFSYFLPESYGLRFMSAIKDIGSFTPEGLTMVFVGRRQDTFKTPILIFAQTA